MSNNLLSPVARAAQAAWKPQDIREPWQWGEDYVEVDNTSPMPGKWRSINSPWVKELMEVGAMKLISFIAVRCSAQSSKTITLLILLLWLISEDPGPTMYVMANKDDAEDFVRDRFEPMLSRCAPAKALLRRATKLNFTFRTMPLYFLGAGSKAKLQGKPMKRLFLDEVRNYPPGALEMVMKRVRAFGALAQIFIVSTGDKKGDSVDAAFERGDQRTPHFPCTKCAAVQQLKFEQLKAEHPETHLCVEWKDVPGAKVDGVWNFEVLGKAIRFQCFKCGHLIADTPTERKTICRTAFFIRMNPKADTGDVSFTWNALLPWWVPWKGIVKEFILARRAAREGNIEPLKTFVNETLGESWEDRLGVIEDYGFLEARKGSYEFGEPWPEESVRFMAADRNEAGGEHYWWVIRAYGNNGKSRLVANGRALTTAELEEKRKLFGVKINNAMIDSGWKASEVYRFCVSTGWKAFKGEPNAEYFLHRVQTGQNTFRTVRRVWERSFVDPFMGKRTQGKTRPIPLFRHCGNATKDLLSEYMTGLVGEWTIPQQVEREYMRQLSGERRSEVTDPKGRISYVWKRTGPNHYLDCELIILTAAIITKLISSRGDS